MAIKPLSHMAQKFAAEYLVDHSATEAAIRAGYSARSAGATGYKLMSDPRVQAAVEKGVAAQQERTGITADVVLFELLRLARVDIVHAFDDAGHLKSLKQIPEDVRRAIAGIEVVEEFEGTGKDRKWTGYTKKIKFWDKTRALELLGKHLKLFVERMEHSGPGGGPIQYGDTERAARVAALLHAARKRTEKK